MQEIAKSSIVYPLTTEDLVASNLFQFRHSPTIRRLQRRSMIVALLTSFFCGLGVPWFTGLMPFWPSLGIALVWTAWTAGYYLYYQKRGYIKRVRKAVEQMDKPHGLLGEHTIEVDEEGITHVSAYSRTRYAWGALDRIESEPGYTYIHLGVLVFIIRHEAIISGDFKTFLEQIGRHHQSGRTIAD